MIQEIEKSPKFSNKNQKEMCGIVAYLGDSPTAADILLAGLLILQNRGYDSAGIATINAAKQLIVNKYASSDDNDPLKKLKETRDAHTGNTIGIAHTRWATHGGKNDENAHPHTDMSGRIAIVHNGIIENYKELQSSLKEKGYIFKSETDTEVVAQLIGYFLDQGDTINSAIIKTEAKLEGTWAIVIIDRETPDRLYILKNGNPLLVGLSTNASQLMIASEAVVFDSSSYNQYISLDHHDIVRIRLIDNKCVSASLRDITNIRASSNKSLNETSSYFTDTYKPTEIKLTKYVQTPAPYLHWTLKEVFEQPSTITAALGTRLTCDNNVKLGGLSNHKDVLLKIKHLLVLGCGSSYFAGLMGAKYFRLFNSFSTIRVIDAAEFTYDDLPSDVPVSEVGMLVLSQSGETKDVHRAVELAKRRDIVVMGVINVVDSLIARDATCGVYINAGRENAVASTKSFTSQSVVLSLIGLWFAQFKHPNVDHTKYISALKDLSSDVSVAFKLHDKCKSLASTLLALPDPNNALQHMFILGRGLAEPIAYESSLKIKEITYIHAEGYSGGALKHGPFSLIEKNTPIILLILDDANFNLMKSTAQEVKARGAYVIVITNNPAILDASTYDHCLTIPNNPCYSSLLTLIPLQLLAYELSVSKKLNPDLPRSLAKTVTVD